MNSSFFSIIIYPLLSCGALSSGPLATLAGVYQDVNGQRPEALWGEAVSLWADWLGQVLPSLLGNQQLRPLAQASAATLGMALDVVRNLQIFPSHV